MRYRFLVTCSVVLFSLLLLVKPLNAQAFSLPDSSTIPGNNVVLQPGEELRCYALRGGTDIATVANANRILRPTSLPLGTSVHVPLPVYSVKANDSNTSKILSAISSGSPEYVIRKLNPAPLYTGGSIILPNSSDTARTPDALCVPYPVTSIWASGNSVTRGQTMVMFVETAESVVCEARYLGHSEPCYAFDDTHYFVMLGVSALEIPGMYTLQLHFALSHYITSVDLPFSVEEGNYGYQYINPPASLYALLDEKVFRDEENYLQPYRDVRTPHRSWALPLGFPLTMQLPISADYGDRRSYGGMLDGYHSGVDYRAWTGLPVLAPAEGVVILNQYLKARGNAILIDHGWGLVTGFWHLSASNVQIGKFVEKGEIIGKVGNTGLSTGSHLHWETWVNGVSVDGKQWLDDQGFGDIAVHFTDM